MSLKVAGAAVSAVGGRISPGASGGAARNAGGAAKRADEQIMKTGSRIIRCIFMESMPLFSPEARKQVFP
jgi:hypothetical protein